MIGILIASMMTIGQFMIVYDSTFSVRAYQVYDGDTIKIFADDLPKPLMKLAIRINGIDTPEKRTRCAAEKKLGYAARDYLISLLQNAEYVTMDNMKWGKYGSRIVADLYIDGKSVAESMIESGHAVAYDGGKKTHVWDESCVSK